MSEHTNINYVDSTANPTMGCSGCELWNQGRKTCYAGVQHARYGGVRNGYSPRFEQITYWPGRMAAAAKWPDLLGRRRPEKPWLGGLPRLVFIGNMGDTLCDAVPFPYLRMEIVGNVSSRAGRRHQWLWLTKRPARMAEFSRWLRERDYPWPPNLWAGTTVTTMETTSRIDDLLRVGDEDTLRYVSVEPQWEAIDLRPWLPRLNWIILGGESGDGQAKNFDIAWAAQMLGHCREADVPLFIKQIGRYAFDGEQRLDLGDSHGADWTAWPECVRVREMPLGADRGSSAVPRPVTTVERGTHEASHVLENEKTGSATEGSQRSTRQDWGDEVASILLGCPNRCRYCFARTRALHYGRITDREAWGTTYLRIGKSAVLKRCQHHGTVRFPQTHDITPQFLDQCVTALRNILAARNKVIVCSKPRLDCIERLCSEFSGNREKVEFRFTIGAMNDAILNFWEPGAPVFAERLACLRHAFSEGFRTSANIEPMLDVPHVAGLYRTVVPFVNVFVNVGLMEDVRLNVQPQTPEEEAEVLRIERGQSIDRLRSLYQDLKDEPLVRWGRSVRRALGLTQAARCT